LQGLHAWRRLRDALLPAMCLLCDLPAGPVPNLCAVCASTLPRLARLARPSRARVVAFTYEPPISTLIHWMKFEANLSAAKTLGVLLADAVVEAMGEPGMRVPDAIVPVPLHRTRLRSRGFNQALELARPIARRLQRPVLVRACLRTRATAPQSGLAALADRRRNVAGAFSLARRLTGLRHVAIVDDVITTGATAREVAHMLRAAGVGEVVIWACAGRAD
jgi:ComF family protein